MTPSEQCKAAGLKSLAELSKISGVSVQTLINWHKDKLALFSTVVSGAVVIKAYSLNAVLAAAGAIDPKHQMENEPQAEKLSEFSAGLERWIVEACKWFCDNNDPSDINEALRDIVGSAVREEREACATECERMIMYRGGKQEAPAHNNVWDAAKAIRMRSNA